MVSDNIAKIIDLKGHIGSIYDLCLGDDGNCFYSVGGDGWVVKWLTDGQNQDGILIAKTDTKLFTISVLFAKNLLVAGDINGHLYWIDLSTQTILARTTAHRKSIFDILVLDDHRFLTVSGDGCMTVWHVDSRSPIISIKLSTQGLRCAAYDEHSQKIFIGASDHNIYIIDGCDFSLESVHHDAHANSVFTLCVDKGQIISGGRDAHLKVRSIATMDLLADHAAHWYTINKVMSLPEVDKIATASRDKNFRLWDRASIDPIETIDVFKGGHHHSVNTMLWIGNQNILATAGDDRIIKLWKVLG